MTLSRYRPSAQVKAETRAFLKKLAAGDACAHTYRLRARVSVRTVKHMEVRT